MSAAAQLVLWIGGLHVLGLLCAAALLIPALRDQPTLPPRRDSGDDGGLGKSPPAPWGGPGGGLPLPDAKPARVRLREPGGLADRLPRAPRRRPREPEPRPSRVDH